MLKTNPSQMKILGVPYTTAHYGMEDMAKKDILKKRKSAKVISYSINYGSLSATMLAVLCENSKTEALLGKKPVLKKHH